MEIGPEQRAVISPFRKSEKRDRTEDQAADHSKSGVLLSSDGLKLCTVKPNGKGGGTVGSPHGHILK